MGWPEKKRPPPAGWSLYLVPCIRIPGAGYKIQVAGLRFL
jgi:hypothetical protein